MALRFVNFVTFKLQMSVPENRMFVARNSEGSFAFCELSWAKFNPISSLGIITPI